MMKYHHTGIFHLMFIFYFCIISGWANVGLLKEEL